MDATTRYAGPWQVCFDLAFGAPDEHIVQGCVDMGLGSGRRKSRCEGGVWLTLRCWLPFQHKTCGSIPCSLDTSTGDAVRLYRSPLRTVWKAWKGAMCRNGVMSKGASPPQAVLLETIGGVCSSLVRSSSWPSIKKAQGAGEVFCPGCKRPNEITKPRGI
ncbi:hypothetical protein K438DRAFT_1984224 [Mycena galopus ATCC 62051]|nr:hypothetical protein K438DRAFT_1984224 [Mycena galopus ATCC 62051]